MPTLISAEGPILKAFWAKLDCVNAKNNSNVSNLQNFIFDVLSVE